MEFGNPVGVITKSALIRRDIDVLQELSRRARMSVSSRSHLRIRETARAVEPYAPLPDARFHARQTLAAAGIQVGIGIAPLFPGLTNDIPELLKAARERARNRHSSICCGCQGSRAPYFEERLHAELPTKAQRI